MLKHFWKKDYCYHSDTLFNKFLFILLCGIEKFYSFFFRIVLCWEQHGIRSYKPPFTVISVGNISCGGTGKSVVTAFLLQRLSHKKGAVFLRGYKGKNEKGNNSFLIDQYNRQDASILSQGGDEAVMLAYMLNVPIVVGKNRATSARLLERHQAQNKTFYNFVVLDDGYQHFSVAKSYEILILDARMPFENGHCLPAGRLREKDISRSHAIICTHAEGLSKEGKKNLKASLIEKAGHSSIFFGKYSVQGIINSNQERISKQSVLSYNLIACAGIGSFLGFKETLLSFDISPEIYIEYEDHYSYSMSDIKYLSMKVRSYPRGALITTRKDLYKLKHLLDRLPLSEQFPLFCIDIIFNFLTFQEDGEFFESLYQHANLG